MSTVTIKPSTTDASGVPSYWEVLVTNSSDSNLPNGTYDGFCLAKHLTISNGGTYTAEAGDGVTLQNFHDSRGDTNLTDTSVAQINWILAQNFTADSKYAGQFSSSDVQNAFWVIYGDQSYSSLNADSKFLVDQSAAAVASGINVTPADNYFSMVVDPAGNKQPIILIKQLGKIGNYVWDDADADGIQDAGEDGVDGVEVELYDDLGNLVATTTTGDDYSTAAVEQGYYQFVGLDAGDYTVKFNAPSGYGLSDQDEGSDDAADSDADITSGRTATIALAAGASNQTIDAGLIELASLGDYVWADNNADGEQNDGQTGVNGVTVKLYDASNTLVATTTTANDGSGNAGYYLFENLRPGDYQVEFVKPDGFVFTAADQVGDSLDSDANTVTGRTATVTLQAGDNDLSVDAGLIELSSIGDYVWEDINQDGVQNDGEAGINGITVNLYDGSGNLLDTTTTANDSNGNAGYYLFDDLPASDYQVEVEAPTGYNFTDEGQGSDGDLDSDVDTTTGLTEVETLSIGEHDLSQDAGLVQTCEALTIRVTASSINTSGNAWGQQADLNAPSFYDLVVTNSSNPNLPNGTYDAYCINPDIGIHVSPITHGASATIGNNKDAWTNAGVTNTITQTQIDQINWLLSQNFTSDAKYTGQFNYGEVQSAIWQLMGYSKSDYNKGNNVNALTDNGRQTVSDIDVAFLVSAAQSAIASGNTVLPANSLFSMIVDPCGTTQPLIIQRDTAKLGDFVWDDTNGNGIQDAGELGVDNVIVELYDSNGVLVSSTTTGDDFSTAAIEQGYYQFTGLAADTYSIKFIAPSGKALSIADAGSDDTADSDADPITATTSVTIAAGDNNQDVDAGLINTTNVSGTSGDDTLNGGVGSDTIDGGAGNDTITGGLNMDTLTGGTGNDTFVFANAGDRKDVITDFDDTADKIKLDHLLQGFNAGSNISDYVQFVDDGSNELMQIDIDGSGSSYGFETFARLDGNNGHDASTLYGLGTLEVDYL